MDETRVILTKLEHMQQSQNRIEGDLKDLKTSVNAELKERDESFRELQRAQGEVAGKVSDLGGRFAIALTLLMALFTGITGVFFAVVNRGGN